MKDPYQVLKQPKKWRRRISGAIECHTPSLASATATPFAAILWVTAGLLKPFAGDRNLAQHKRCRLDRLYQRVTDDLGALFSWQ
jgi:hypothetical protein